MFIVADLVSLILQHMEILVDIQVSTYNSDFASG